MDIELLESVIYGIYHMYDEGAELVDVYVDQNTAEIVADHMKYDYAEDFVVCEIYLTHDGKFTIDVVYEALR